MIKGNFGWKIKWNSNPLEAGFHQEILLDFADFALQEQLEDNLTISVSRVYHGRQANQIARIALYNDPVFDNEQYTA